MLNCSRSSAISARQCYTTEAIPTEDLIGSFRIENNFTDDSTIGSSTECFHENNTNHAVIRKFSQNSILAKNDVSLASTTSQCNSTYELSICPLSNTMPKKTFPLSASAPQSITNLLHVHTSSSTASKRHDSTTTSKGTVLKLRNCNDSAKLNSHCSKSSKIIDPNNTHKRLNSPCFETNIGLSNGFQNEIRYSFLYKSFYFLCKNLHLGIQTYNKCLHFFQTYNASFFSISK